MTKVVSLHGDSVVMGSKPVEETVRLLREYLEQAERGEIVGFAIVAIKPSHNFSTQWTEPGGFRNSIMAGALTLNHRVGKTVDEE